MKEYSFELKHPFSYANNGQTNDASFISLKAPTFKQMSQITPIKQAFMLAISDVTDSDAIDKDAKDDDSDDSINITGLQVMQVMYRGSGDMTKVLLHAEQFFKSGVAMVEGEVKLTTPLMEKMHLDDFEGLVGAYIANFIAPSLMDGQ